MSNVKFDKSFEALYNVAMNMADNCIGNKTIEARFSKLEEEYQEVVEAFSNYLEEVKRHEADKELTSMKAFKLLTTPFVLMAAAVLILFTAHSFSYHILKVNPFDRAISKYIRKGEANRKILLLNGVRVEESENRADNFGDNPYREVRGNIWVNIIHWWDKNNCLELLEAENFKRSPVAIALGRSGECNCGTMQDEVGRMACADFEPEWGVWMNTLRRYVVATFGFDINQNPDKKIMAEMRAKVAELDAFMPMCVGCKAQQLKLL